jgi:ribonuclease-3
MGYAHRVNDLSMSEPDISKLEKSLDYTFKKRVLLREALTHKSFSHEHPQQEPLCNERLEFLGDSVLGFVIVEYLFLSKSQFSESVMSKAKSYLVQESILTDIARSLSLGRYLRFGKGEEATGGRKKGSILADAVEAVLGAVYLDGGYRKVRGVILKLFKERIDTVISSGDFHDFKSDLQERSQLLSGTVPEYRLVKQEGKEHDKIFTVAVYVSGEKLGTGFGKNKKQAEALAAREALKKLSR